MIHNKKYINRIKQKIEIIENPSIINNTKNISNDINRLINRKSLVPVICEDMFEYEDPQTKERQPLHSYILEKLLLEFNSRLQMTKEEFENILSDSYYAVSLLKEKTGKDLYYAIFNSLIDENDNLLEGVCLKKEIALFLKVCQFPLIITTNSFAIIEKELGMEYESYWTKIGRQNDQVLPDKCIYHIFGEAELETSNWGYNDKQILRFITSYYSDYPLKNLTATICENYSHKTLLFLGSNAPDWLFRFILNPIYGEDIYDDSKGFYISKGTEESLSLFLRDIKFEKEEQMLDVINMVIEKQKKNICNQMVQNTKKYDYFVAHASEDIAIARDLVDYLRANGKKVWFDDNETKKGGEYWKRIIDGLQNSTYFMPIITENYISKLRDTKSREEAFCKCNIPKISFDVENLALLDDELPGIVVELALAEEICKRTIKDQQEIVLYSLPIIVEGTYFYATPITMNYLETLSKNSNYLPQNLFDGKQMYMYDTKLQKIMNFNIADF